MALQLHFNDLNEFDHAPLPDSFAKFKNWSKDAFLQLNNPKAGSVGINVFALPHLQLMQFSWQTENNGVKLHGHEKPARTIGISFQIAGLMETKFTGIKTLLPMREGTHNLVYTPECGDEHLVPAGNALDALQMNLDEDFFKSCIGTDSRWSEQVLMNLEKEIPFSGVSGAAESTPAMKQLIQSIVQLPQSIPMRNLLIQSRALELLALQFEQFARAATSFSVVSADDAQKLHQLKIYLDLHFLEELSITALCRRFYINEFKLKKGFKLLFNDTVFGYLRRLRMEYALRMLRNGNISIDQVAYELGYEHAQHFSTAFRKFYGDSPSAYSRKRILV